MNTPAPIQKAITNSGRDYEIQKNVQKLINMMTHKTTANCINQVLAYVITDSLLIIFIKNVTILQ